MINLVYSRMLGQMPMTSKTMKLCAIPILSLLEALFSFFLAPTSDSTIY